ncbi:MAG: hypothetical protein M9921_08365 [Fimbriimonadaceae bacterium]|nr:hypothetical protein [Chthonomonadaceae bacterium]MCO5296856.1 hypothetical protein [Fimbriimonadaceae bacterium]
MKRQVAVWIAMVGLASVAMGVQQPQGPVTRPEATAVFKRVGTALSIFTGGKAKPFAPKFAPTGVLTRTELVREFDRVFEAAKPYFKYTPRPVKFDAAVFSIKDEDARNKLDKLVKWGCVARIGPVATAPKDELALAEFGDAVGFLLIRIAELTHTPSSKWTPAMMHGDG